MVNAIDLLAKFDRVGTNKVEKIGMSLVRWFHLITLIAIGAAIVWSAVNAIFGMLIKGQASVEDILLLFIYLELGAMVGIYFRTNSMPVRFLIYVALTAMTRLLISMANVEHFDIQIAISTPHWGLIIVILGVFVLSVAVLILRYASYKYQSDRPVTGGDHEEVGE